MPDAISLYARMREIVVSSDLRGGDHVYLLIDQCAFPNLSKRKAALTSLPHDSFLTSETALDGASPLLVEIDTLAESGETQQLVAWICEQGKWANGLILLRSPLPFTELQARLKIRTEARLPDNFAVLLRFFDGRTLPRLAAILTPAQRKQFFGCAKEWHYVDRDGVLQTVKEVHFEEEDSFEAPMEFDVKQQNALIDAAQTDAVVDQLLGKVQIGPEGSSPPEKYRCVAPLVAAAKSYGIEDIPHVAIFSMVGLKSGVDFHLQAPWKPVLEQVRAGAISFMQALDILENAE